FREASQPQRSQDLGNLLFMAVLLWAYLSFSQFLLIWSANLPEEVPWILARVYSRWGAVAAVVLLLHFAVPFLLLLSADLKRNPAALAAVAGLLLVLRLVDTFWWVAPAFHPDGPRLHWLDPAAATAVGGLWVAAWLFLLGRRPLGTVETAAAEAAHG
ncbi:MAG TPA: hypothetical protein VEJ18_03355, partial [Planctomycetota bacterium]|nr:hypothetical protein [Planctomycetota bacterium]